MLNEIEHRAVELRAESEGVLSGVLIPYGVPSDHRRKVHRDMGGWVRRWDRRGSGQCAA